jgi:hypothetical protein
MRKVQLLICVFVSISLSTLTKPLDQHQKASQSLNKHSLAMVQQTKVITEVLFVRFCFKLIKIWILAIHKREEGLTCPIWIQGRTKGLRTLFSVCGIFWRVLDVLIEIGPLYLYLYKSAKLTMVLQG